MSVIKDAELVYMYPDHNGRSFDFNNSQIYFDVEASIRYFNSGSAFLHLKDGLGAEIIYALALDPDDGDQVLDDLIAALMLVKKYRDERRALTANTQIA